MNCKAACPQFIAQRSSFIVALDVSSVLLAGIKEKGRVPVKARALSELCRLLRAATLTPGLVSSLNKLGGVASGCTAAQEVDTDLSGDSALPD